MIYSTLRAFLDQPVMMIVATVAPKHGASLARCVGLRLHGDEGPIDLLVSRLQWPDLADALATDGPAALTLVQPGTYRTYQAKGRVTAIADADAADLMLARAYIADVGGALRGLGVAAHAIDHWLTDRDVVRVGFRADALFDQTPGPRAGAQVSA